MNDVKNDRHDETTPTSTENKNNTNNNNTNVTSQSKLLPPLQTTDRSPDCRALIVHPRFKDRHPIYHCLTKQLQTWRHIPIAGFSIPFVIRQNFDESQGDLGSVVWSGGIAAAAYLRRYVQEQQNFQHNIKPYGWGSMTCLELGCGTAALVSQCAALVGMRSVMTDLSQVVEWAKENVQHNFPTQWRAHPRLQESLVKSEPGSISPLLSARTLCWGEASDIPSEEFDIVVAADCLYATRDDPDLKQKLLFTLKGLLANGRTKLLISYQLRSGKEATFVHETLPTIFPDYVAEEILPRDDKKNNMLWFLPRNAAAAAAAASRPLI